MNGLETNMVILVSNTVWHCGRLIMARLRLVIATRLHRQFPSFWLCISSNTSSCSDESQEWNTLANPISHALSILQHWLEKRLDKPSQFKARFINQANRPLDKLHPRSMTSTAWTQKSREKLSNLAIDFFLGKEWWRLGGDILRVYEYSRMVYQHSKWRNWVTEVSATTRCFLMVNGASMKMHEANPLNEVRGKVRGDNNLKEANESIRW
jgi:hypothetical protein